MRTVSIIWYGAFWQFVHTIFTTYFPDTEVLIYSHSNGTNPWYASWEKVCTCDIIFPCVPISQFETTIHAMLPHLSAKSIIFDICTVKTYPVDILKHYTTQIRYIATHPMFWPNSYVKRDKSLTWLRMVICDTNLDTKSYTHIIDQCSYLGLDIIEQTAQEHDEHLATSLFLTHYVGQIIFDAWFDRTNIDTASFGYLMDAVEIVRSNKELFQDVYRYNPYCKQLIKDFNNAREKVEEELSLLQ